MPSENLKGYLLFAKRLASESVSAIRIHAMYSIERDPSITRSLVFFEAATRIAFCLAKLLQTMS